MTIDILVRGWRFYLDVSKPKPRPAEERTSTPVGLTYPLQVSPGYVGYYQTRAADATEARK